MQQDAKTISLGFTPQLFPVGMHICQIVGYDAEREEALLQFLSSGLRAGERARCFSDNIAHSRVSEFFQSEGVSYDTVTASGAFAMGGVREIYFSDGRFDPDRMLAVLTQYYDESLAQGYTAARVIGEMSPEVQTIPGGDRLLEYESRISQLLRTYPLTTVCQYDARCFSGATIMDILKVHPLMVLRGSVVHNPFFITPEEFLAG